MKMLLGRTLENWANSGNSVPEPSSVPKVKHALKTSFCPVKMLFAGAFDVNCTVEGQPGILQNSNRRFGFFCPAILIFLPAAGLFQTAVGHPILERGCNPVSFRTHLLNVYSLNYSQVHMLLLHLKFYTLEFPVYNQWIFFATPKWTFWTMLATSSC